ncbi:MAG TPA: dTDP-4-dehydrorhamnose 3,5-epimerase [Ignavibacteria bacterium]|nr:dTDP-4-dehydrorhamnose 3,5-epimerase [Ignavibacteria bacterium]
MNVLKTELDGVLVIEPDFFEDSRGYFFESYNKMKYESSGLNFNFVQDNISKSQKGTVRGLHYQIGSNAQGKLCQVITGAVIDTAVDIRFGSPTYGKHFSVLLSGENHKQIWIPPGFAHGFSVLTDVAIFLYKCTEFYSKKDERAILYNDPDLKIDWRVEKPVVSEKDLKAELFKNIEKDFIF